MNISNPVIELSGVSKKFGTNWIFRNINTRFAAGKKYAITGPNGSGKSTLLKIIAGIVTPNEGAVSIRTAQGDLNVNDLFQFVSFCAPYLELPEELTLPELLNFHAGHRKLTVSQQQFLDAVQLEAGKEIRNYSSGMKQRLKLALAFYTESPIIFLDEPTAMLDHHWIAWYHQLIAGLTPEKLLIISSNEPAEYSFCDEILDIAQYIHVAKGK